ncbi:hypothetical protein EKO04_002069 [Ascochyta lentis]|uniref:Uncharacterized protein n=1 Tax=Ascochyta lentis TaxID=205686 RepID=A0A8H7J961_9PLEO|nr:hypothetical protein EKO04_002069 [Ascochyta lentis]
MANLHSVPERIPELPSSLSDEQDQVYPVHMLDDTTTLRGIVMTWTLCFNDVLDANRLHTALSRLLEIGDWKKLGGRLRLKNGGLEIYVPPAFTAERPAVSYTTRTFEMPIQDHPIARLFPQATEKPSLHPGPQEFRSFATRDDAPQTLEDYLVKDTPQLSLHVTSFTNATIVGLSFPHTLMDVMGQQALLRSWSLVLAGNEAEVPPLLGAREDALISAIRSADHEKEEHTLKPKRIEGWSLLRFTMRFVWDYFWYKTVETRTICFPAHTVTELHQQARNDLNSGSEKGEKPFISEGDVLTAWAIRAIASSLPHPRPVTAMQAINARFRLKALRTANGVHVQNMAISAFTFLPHDLATGPLGPIALENRRHLAQQATEQQIVANLVEMQRQGKGHVDPCEVLYGTADALVMPFSSWSRADLFRAAQFAPAVLRGGDRGADRWNPSGTVVFQHGSSMRQTATARNFFMVVGRDYGGNCWVSGTLLPATWVVVEEEVRRLRHG